MRETHYIESDEEIITAVGRLRQSGQSENVFVFPKRALILQSVVNLRLLEREAKKLGKRIIVVTQDEAGKKIAEKAGLMVEEYREQTAPTVAAPLPPKAPAAPAPESMSIQSSEPSRHRSQDIGSDDFFAGSAQGTIRASESTPEVAPKPEPALPSARTLSVRNATPQVLTSLNSMRDPETTVTPPVRKTAPRMDSPQGRPTAPPKALSDMTAPRSAWQPKTAPEVSPELPESPEALNDPVPKPRLSQFMQRSQQVQSVSQSVPWPQATLPTREVSSDTAPILPPARIQAPRTSEKHQSNTTGAGLWIKLSIAGCLVAGLAGVAWYVFFPSAQVVLKPRTAQQLIKLPLVGMSGAGSVDENVVPARMVTLERSVHVSEHATQHGGDQNAKAKGKIRIYNDFSSDSQSLVATTRFETKEGKIFRLVQGVTVPGMRETNGEKVRGMVEAAVVADQPGDAYNIGPTTFTIPGFKGSPKFDRFSAESTQAFTGGGGGAGVGPTTVGTADTERALSRAREEARTLVLDEVKKNLKDGEVVIEESLKFTDRSAVSNPPIGGATENFEFEARFEVQVFVLEESAVRKKIEAEELTQNNVTLFPSVSDIRYTAILPRYDTGRIDLTAESQVQFTARLDEPKLKETLLGKNEAGIRTILEEHPEIERLQVTFTPQLLITTIPSQSKRVEVRIEP